MMIKKLIAREGLAILVFAFIAGACILLDNSIPSEDPTYRYKLLTGGHEYEVILSSYCSESSSEDAAFVYSAVQKLYPKDFNPEYKKLGFIPADLKIVFLGHVWTPKQHLKHFFSTGVVVVLFVFYPLYLIWRFVSWALRTLRAK